MKKLIAALLALSLIFALCACSGKGKTADKAEVKADSKVLVIYYSSVNTSGADVVSSATSKVGDIASTEYLAEYIHNKVGGDIAKITPVKDYPTGYDEVVDLAKEEKSDDVRPEFMPLDVNPEDYDIIFIGYPIWWYTRPMILYTFFDKYDFSGKTIIPFNTHEGSGNGGTYDEIKKDEPNATVLDGLAVRGNSAEKSDKEIDNWLDSLGY